MEGSIEMTNRKNICKILMCVVLPFVIIFIEAGISEADLLADIYPQIIDQLMNFDTDAVLDTVVNTARNNMGKKSGDEINKLYAIENSLNAGGVSSVEIKRHKNEIERKMDVSGFSSQDEADRALRDSENKSAIFITWVGKQNWITARDRQKLIDNVNKNYAGFVKSAASSFSAQ